MYNQYLDERKKTMNSTKFEVDDAFADNFSKNSVSPKQITKLINFLPKIM